MYRQISERINVGIERRKNEWVNRYIEGRKQQGDIDR